MRAALWLYIYIRLPMPRLASTHAPREIAAQVPPSTTHITCMSRSPLYLLSSGSDRCALFFAAAASPSPAGFVESRTSSLLLHCAVLEPNNFEREWDNDDRRRSKTRCIYCGMFSESSTLPLLLYCDLFLHTQNSHMMSIERAANESTADNLRTQRSEPGSHQLLKVMFSYLDRRPISRWLIF